jgi:hypothetical protein
VQIVCDGRRFDMSTWWVTFCHRHIGHVPLQCRRSISCRGTMGSGITPHSSIWWATLQRSTSH